MKSLRATLQLICTEEGPNERSVITLQLATFKLDADRDNLTAALQHAGSVKRRPERDEVQWVELPASQRGAAALAEKKAAAFASFCGWPFFLFEALRPLLVSLYLQGVVVGYTTRERETEKQAVELGRS